MVRMKHLLIWRDTNRLMVLIKGAVRLFLRYHKYMLGRNLHREWKLFSRKEYDA